VVERFRPGEPIAIRHVWRGRIFLAAAMIVVQDEPDLLVTWLPPGAEYKRPERREELPYEQPLVDRPWREPGVVQLTRPGDAHSVIVFPGANWYVNLQEPLRRSRIGFDTADHLLDLVRTPGGEWRWKDEHELVAAVERGFLTSREAAAIREEGERVIAADGFPTGWEDFEPDPDWRAPRLPSGWDEVR
jgi:Protein of unknown function (DUF402)